MSDIQTANDLKEKFNYISQQKALIKLRRHSISAVLLVCFSFAYQNIKAQTDPQFTQNMFNRLAYNPGAAGFNSKVNIFGLYRDQWAGIEGNPKTMVFNVDMPVTIFNKESGIGLSVINDKIGLYSNLTINFLYSYRKRLWNGTLGAGIRAGFVNSEFDGSKIYIPDQGDYYSASAYSQYKITEAKSVFDSGLGVFYESSQWHGGISVTHLFEPTISLAELGDVYYLKRNLYLSLGYNYELLNKKYVIQPSFLYKRDGVVGQIDLNIMLTYNDNFWGGITVRPQDALAALFGLRLKNGVGVTYAYDITTSKLRYATWGSHEISVHYAFDMLIGKKQNKYKSIRIL